MQLSSGKKTFNSLCGFSLEIKRKEWKWFYELRFLTKLISNHYMGIITKNSMLFQNKLGWHLTNYCIFVDLLKLEILL